MLENTDAIRTHGNARSDIGCAVIRENGITLAGNALDSADRLGGRGASGCWPRPEFDRVCVENIREARRGGRGIGTQAVKAESLPFLAGSERTGVNQRVSNATCNVVGISIGWPPTHQAGWS